MICLFCELRSAARPQYPQWLQIRGYASRKRRPAREQLSQRVSQPAPRLSQAPRGRMGSPFGGMNRTAAAVRGSQVQKQMERPSRAPRGKETRKNQGRKEGEYKALKMQQALSKMPYKSRNAIKSKIQELDTFEQFSLLPIIQESIKSQALKGLTDITPTPIQRVAIPALLRTGKKKKEGQEAQQYLIAAETGSGKTLAYLLPIIDSFKRIEALEREEEAAAKAAEEAEEKSDNRRMFSLDPRKDPDYKSTPARPRAIILVPTAELVEQVTALAKSLCHTIKFRVSGISAAHTSGVIHSRMFRSSGVDLLVATPHLLNSIAETEPKILSKVSHLVIDEADSLFDRSFAPETMPIVDRATPSLQQLILCSATIPRSLDNFLHKQFPTMQRLVTPNLHAIPRRVQLGVVEVDQDPYRGDKRLACADTIWTIGKSIAEHATEEPGLAGDESGVAKETVPIKRIIVFVNERDTCKSLTEYLRGKGIDAVALSRHVNDDERQSQLKALADFTGSSSSTTSAAPSPFLSSSPSPTPRRPGSKPNYFPVFAAPAGKKPVRALPNTKVLVATDLGSRGIDTTAVRHVILFDCPHSTIDFIHRLGRAGRMGRRGRGIVLLGKGDRRDVVKEVREGMFMGKALI